MKKLRVSIAASLVFLLSSVLWVGVANGHSFRSGDTVSIGQSEKIEDTIFAYGKTIDISSEVYGDIFCAGQNVTISGNIHGDVICAGQTLRVTGTVDGDVRLAGQSVSLGAAVSGNATVAGQTFIVESTSKIAGDLSIGASEATINGPVGRDIALGGERVTLGSTVARNVRGSTNSLTLGSGAAIAGNLDYTSRNIVNKDPSAKVLGKISRTEPTKHNNRSNALLAFRFGWFAYWFLALLAISMVLVLLFPRAVHATSNQAMPTPWKALAVGFVAALAIPVAFFVLLFTIVGIPLALLMLLAWILIMAVSGPISGYYLGRLILKDRKDPLIAMLTGASILLVLYFIPIINIPAILAAFWIGTGMILLQLFEITKRRGAHHDKAATKRATLAD